MGQVGPASEEYRPLTDGFYRGKYHRYQTRSGKIARCIETGSRRNHIGHLRRRLSLVGSPFSLLFAIDETGKKRTSLRPPGSAIERKSGVIEESHWKPARTIRGSGSRLKNRVIGDTQSPQENYPAGIQAESVLPPWSGPAVRRILKNSQHTHLPCSLDSQKSRQVPRLR